MDISEGHPMKLLLIGIAAALVAGAARAQAPDAAQRAENRAKARELVDKATPGPAQRARNRAKAAELADKVTPDADRRAKNRAKAGNVADKTADGTKRAGRAAKRDVEAMGAGSAVNTASADDRGDSRRRERMDDAYGNWQRQHGSR
jgi:pyruvate/2-oxoglutarate dehydrogenase complex dihydrolipoamide acyltransferase (E2) component